ncbi:hypothetical protein BAE44_0011584 [Dichanthelium oligosanthes]|uniref:Uncharacterized protein n=1 Tax=Dichanthelium oligosanthes TaxID=888268 RepID=A0A1E5VQK3_9POAL|nr:hypothetical protein BAE44_0011584 [Dichanthelium oligosanthes]
MTMRKEPFQPRVEGKVSMYVCGVTPYDFSHVGHSRAYVAFDVLHRTPDKSFMKLLKQDLVKEHHKKFLEHMSDDVKTAEVLDQSFMKLLKAINSNLEDLKVCWKLQERQQQKQQQPQKQEEDYIQDLIAMETEIKYKLSILGLMPPSSLAEVLKQLKDKALKRAGLTEEQLQEQVEQRAAARKNKQFEVSDGIRNHLATLGISLMDEPTGTTWRPCEPE